MTKTLEQEITDDFVESYQSEKDFKFGPVNGLLLMGVYPEGVDPTDPRVVAIIRRIETEGRP